MDSNVVNYQKLAKAHENFALLHIQDISIYLTENLAREQEASLSRGSFTQIHRQKNEEI